MPSPRKTLTAGELRRYVQDTCFAPTSDRRVGIEVEFLTVPVAHPNTHADFDLVGHALAGAGAPPQASRVTFEPGGQFELSSPLADDVGAACTAIAFDLDWARTALAAEGIALAGVGLDPVRRNRRVVALPRYAAMEAYFDAGGPSGRTMMCGTAAIQVNLDIGDADGAGDRWRLAHAIGPTLAAAFANSPIARGRATEWQSARLANWWEIDRTRTFPAEDDEIRDETSAWLHYALRANVMLIRLDDDRFVPQLRAVSFEQWMANGHDLGYPTLDDFAYHLTTLFPPVRPRGWLEMRTIDALPDPLWRVAAAVSTALLDDDEAADRARWATAGAAEQLWIEAFHDGLRHPVLARAAAACFAAARDALSRVGADPETIDATEDFIDRYVARERSPADDRRAEWREQPALMASPVEEATWT